MLTSVALDDSRIISALKDGAVGVLPTDTIYGVVCRAADVQAVGRLYALKSRERKPGTVIAASVEQLVELGVPARYVSAVGQYWPNPISIILPAKPELSYLDFGMSLATRIPSFEPIRKLLEKTGPLLTSSANHPGESPAVTIDDAQTYFGNEVDFYVDGGDLSDRPPSTIIRIVDDEVEVIREGAVKINEYGEIYEPKG